MKHIKIQEAKNRVAKKYGYKSWFEIDFYQIDSFASNISPLSSEEVLRDEAMQEYSSHQLSDYKRRLKEEIEKKIVQSNQKAVTCQNDTFKYVLTIIDTL